MASVPSTTQISKPPAAESMSSPCMAQQRYRATVPAAPHARSCSKLELTSSVLPSRCCSQSLCPRPQSQGSSSPRNMPESSPGGRKGQPKDQENPRMCMKLNPQTETPMGKPQREIKNTKVKQPPKQGAAASHPPTCSLLREKQVSKPPSQSFLSTDRFYCHSGQF